MAIKTNFRGRTVIEPGSYSQIIGGSTQVPPSSSFGKVMLIDTGKNDGWGFGGGINGELSNGKNSVYEFSDATEFKEAVRGGLYYDLVNYLFRPSSNGQGIESIKYVRASTTTSATITFEFTGAGSSDLSNTPVGTLVIKTRNEGITANGILHNGVLVKGFAAKLMAGILDTDKFKMVFYSGSFNGVNNESPNFSIDGFNPSTTYSINSKVYYNGIVWMANDDAIIGKVPGVDPEWDLYEYSDNYGGSLPGVVSQSAIASSPEFSTLKELTDWMEINPTFNFYFKLTSKIINDEVGTLDNDDLLDFSDFVLAEGGTSSYNSSDLDKVLDNITEEDNSFFLCDDYALNAKSANNTKILSHVINDAEFSKILVIGGGANSEYLKGDSGSIGIAKYFNSSKVSVVHSNIKVPRIGGGEKELTSIYHAAMFLGRTAGNEPQVPTTWKDISISSPVHELSKKERELALMAGVIHTKFVPGKGWVINQSINSLQRNETLFLPDGDSYEVSIERIKMQLNKELVLSSRVLFVGGNLNTASAEDVKLFVEGYLVSRTARPNLDNLIISFRDIKVELQGDAWKISYGFVPNSPINKLFFTGVMLDANIKI